MTFRMTISKIIGVAPSDIVVVKPSKSANMLQSRSYSRRLDDIGMDIAYDISIVVGEGNSFTSVDDAFATTKNMILASVGLSSTDPNSFTSILQSTSVENGADDMASVVADQDPTVSEPEVTILQPAKAASTKKGSSSTLIIIVIVVFVSAVIAASVGYHFYSKRTNLAKVYVQS